MYYSQCSDLRSIESKKLYRSQSVVIDGTEKFMQIKLEKKKLPSIIHINNGTPASVR